MATNCTSCHQRIIWAVSPAGARLPLDGRTWDELVAEGNLVTMTSPARYVLDDLNAVKYDPAAHEGRTVYVSHFATCATRDQHKKPKP